MNNFEQKGDVLSLIAPSGGVVSGKGYLIGALFVVAAVTVAQGLPFSGQRSGVFTFVAATHATTQALSAGDPAYWDDTNKRVTKTAAGNTMIGVVVEDKASTAASAKVALIPHAVSPAAAIADLALGAVTGVDGTGSNAASKADVDARFATIVTKVNAIITALESAGTILA